MAPPGHELREVLDRRALSPTPVLLYHGFLRHPVDRMPTGLFIDVATFRSQLESLLAHGYRPLTLDQFLTPGHKSGRDLLITIDDGFRSVTDLAVPILEELKIPALLAVPPGLIPPAGRGFLVYDELMTPAELGELGRHGIEIGAHGLDHTDLRLLPGADLASHLDRARHGVADIVGYQPRVVAYPGGSYDRRVVEAAWAAGYEAGFGVGRAMGRFGIPRLNVDGAWTIRRLRVELMAAVRIARRIRLTMLGRYREDRHAS